jgi:hypothetical protein
MLARVLLLVVALAAAAPARAQTLPAQSTAADPREDFQTQLRGLADTAISLPLATALGAALAFRPRRRGTPERAPAVVDTQIILAIVGALVMLVVGQSLARAFGIVGAASLIRYRAKIDDPKDAGVMLTALGLGLASGVGLYLLAAFATVFVLGVLWVVESFEPRAMRLFTLKVTAKNPERLKPRIEQVLRRNKGEFDLRTATAEELSYEVRLPHDRRTEGVSNQLLELEGLGVDWGEKNDK